MSTAAYYNEFDPFAAQWLRNLISAGLIAPGDVDERSITDVHPDDLKGYTQCHFFAGIGGWSLAARMAGWDDARPLWSGSCPCQPYSVAGKGEGQDDERDLWPDLFRLIDARAPAVIVGEQVAAAVGKDWLDRVYVDLEGRGYACGAAIIPACAVDAPHRRDRLWFVADREDSGRREEYSLDRGFAARDRAQGLAAGLDASGGSDGVADRPHVGFDIGTGLREGGSVEHRNVSSDSGGSGDVADDDSHGSQPRQQAAASAGQGDSFAAGHSPLDDAVSPRLEGYSRYGNGRSQWALATGPTAEAGGSVFVVGHDGKARRIEPSIRLLAHGVPGRVGQLRAYGNAIVPQVAAEVLGAYLDAC